MLQGEHSAIFSTFIKLPFVIKIFVLFIFEWQFYTGFTVLKRLANASSHFLPIYGLKGALTRYGKVTWKSAHAWNLITLCLLIAWGMTFIFMVHFSFYAIPLQIYDVMYDIATTPKGNQI